GAVAHPRDVVGDEIVAEPVALVDRAPEIAGLRMNAEPHAVAQPAGKHAAVLPVRIEHQHRGAIRVVAPRGAEAALTVPALDLGRAELLHAFADVRRRTDRDEHLPAVAREGDVPRDMSTLDAAASGAGEGAHDGLGPCTRLEIADPIGKADHR